MSLPTFNVRFSSDPLEGGTVALIFAGFHVGSRMNLRILYLSLLCGLNFVVSALSLDLAVSVCNRQVIHFSCWNLRLKVPEFSIIALSFEQFMHVKEVSISCCSCLREWEDDQIWGRYQLRVRPPRDQYLVCIFSF